MSRQRVISLIDNAIIGVIGVSGYFVYWSTKNLEERIWWFLLCLALVVCGLGIYFGFREEIDRESPH